MVTLLTTLAWSRKLDHHEEYVPAAPDAHARQSAPACLIEHALELSERLDRLAVDAQDEVPLAQAGIVPGRARLDLEHDDPACLSRQLELGRQRGRQLAHAD